MNETHQDVAWLPSLPSEKLDILQIAHVKMTKSEQTAVCSFSRFYKKKFNYNTCAVMCHTGYSIIFLSNWSNVIMCVSHMTEIA